jgi:pimeloyl-ACP methyl ester carboxylesterase
MICRRIATFLPLLVLAALLTCGQVLAQSGSSKGAPKPETVTFQTKDGVALTGTYYKSSAGKDATPVVLLADWKDSRAVFDSIAKRLQTPDTKAGDKHPSFAVLTVDLRGHGDSTKQRLGNQTRDLDAAKIDRNMLGAMVAMDMNAVRRFLVEKNDAGELNINKLSLIGAGLGASVAVNWAALDWSYPPLAVGKQGQDVKALVLISPEWSYKGLQMNQALRQPGVREKVAMLLMYGSGERSNVADAKRIEKQLERYHPVPDNLPEGEPNSLASIGPSTKLQGTKFLTQAGANAEDAIIKFLTIHVAKKEFPWSERSLR